MGTTSLTITAGDNGVKIGTTNRDRTDPEVIVHVPAGETRTIDVGDDQSVSVVNMVAAGTGGSGGGTGGGPTKPPASL